MDINEITLPPDSEFILMVAASRGGRTITINETDTTVELCGTRVTLAFPNRWWDYHRIGKDLGIPGECFVNAPRYMRERKTPLIPYRILFALARKGFDEDTIEAAVPNADSFTNFVGSGQSISLKQLFRLLDCCGLTLPEILGPGMDHEMNDISFAALAEKNVPAMKLFHSLSRTEMKILVGVARLMKSNKPASVVADAVRELIFHYLPGELYVRDPVRLKKHYMEMPENG